jgi:hypothetical protein
MHIIQNYTLKKNVVKKILPLVMALLQGIKNLFGPLLMTWTADSPTHRYGESIFDYEYLHEFEFES